MTLKDVIEKWTPQSWRRMAMAGTLAVSGVAGAQTTLEPVDPPDLYSSCPGYSGVAVAYDGNDRYVHAAKERIEYIFNNDLNSGPFDTLGHAIGDSSHIIDQASAEMNVYHLKDDGEVVKTSADDVSIIPSFTSIGTFNNYDHLAAVQIGTDDYLILVEKDGTDPHYRIWDVTGADWVMDSGSPLEVGLPTTIPGGFNTSDSKGAGAYLASDGTSSSQNISNIILALNWSNDIFFFKEGYHLSNRDCSVNNLNYEIQDVAFNPNYSNNRSEIFVSTDLFGIGGEVARLAIDNEGTYENLPIYVNPVAIITGDTEGLEDEQPNPQISITLSRHPNDKSDTLSTVPPVPEVPITVEYSIGGSATRGVGQDYTIDGE